MCLFPRKYKFTRRIIVSGIDFGIMYVHTYSVPKCFIRKPVLENILIIRFNLSTIEIKLEGVNEIISDEEK